MSLAIVYVQIVITDNWDRIMRGSIPVHLFVIYADRIIHTQNRTVRVWAALSRDPALRSPQCRYTGLQQHPGSACPMHSGDLHSWNVNNVEHVSSQPTTAFPLGTIRDGPRHSITANYATNLWSPKTTASRVRSCHQHRKAWRRRSLLVVWRSESSGGEAYASSSACNGVVRLTHASTIDRTVVV